MKAELKNFRKFWQFGVMSSYNYRAFLGNSKPTLKIDELELETTIFVMEMVVLLVFSIG